jgi:hypothetical protein
MDGFAPGGGYQVFVGDFEGSQGSVLTVGLPHVLHKFANLSDPGP